MKRNVERIAVGLVADAGTVQKFRIRVLLCLLGVSICSADAVAAVGRINLSGMTGVEFKTGMADQGVPVFDDLTFGVSASRIVMKLDQMMVIAWLFRCLKTRS